MTGNPLDIRPATQADIPDILAIERQSSGAAHWTVGEYERLIEGGVVLVSGEAGKTRGFLCAKAIAGEWEIENIAVAPEFRRHGVAVRMLRALVHEAEKRSGTAIFLEVRESNLPARQFYAKCGFLEVGRRHQYYQQPAEDAVLYKLPLVPHS